MQIHAMLNNFTNNFAVTYPFTVSLLVCGILVCLWIWVRSCIVQCWFCNGSVKVSWKERNAFICIHCRQYNGFSSDGGYNRAIDAQHQSNSSAQYATIGNFRCDSDVLCTVCTENQSIINKRIANFEPLDENNWETEFTIYKRRIERDYALCTDCLQKSKSRINKINRQIFPGFVEWLRSTRRASNQPVRERISRRRANGAIPDTASHRPLLPRWLHFLVRLACLTCFILLTLGPITSALITRFCTVSTRCERTWSVKLLALLWPKSLLATSQFCPYLINLLPIFILPEVGQLWCAILFFTLQGISTGIDGWLYDRRFKSSAGQFHHTAANPFVMLFNLSLLVFAGRTLFDGAAKLIITKASLNYSYLQLSDRYIYLGVISVSLIVFISASIYGIKMWLSFCSSDWRKQKQKLTEYWPNELLQSRPSSPSSFSSNYPSTVLGHSVSPSTIPNRADHLTSCKIPRNFKSLSISAPQGIYGNRSPTSKSTINFRPSLLSIHSTMGSVKDSGSPLSDNQTLFSCPAAFNKPTSAFSSDIPDHKGFALSDSDDDNSFVTSVSNLKRFQVPQPPSVSPRDGRSSSTRWSDHVDKHPRRRRRKSHRRKGILRFCLTLLFGQLHTWTDVVSELTCLLNALLLASIIYGIVCILLCLLQF